MSREFKERVSKPDEYKEPLERLDSIQTKVLGFIISSGTGHRKKALIKKTMSTYEISETEQKRVEKSLPVLKELGYIRRDRRHRYHPTYMGKSYITELIQDLVTEREFREMEHDFQSIAIQAYMYIEKFKEEMKEKDFKLFYSRSFGAPLIYLLIKDELGKIKDRKRIEDSSEALEVLCDECEIDQRLIDPSRYSISRSELDSFRSTMKRSVKIVLDNLVNG